MAFNTGKSSKETFKALSKMTPQKRLEAVSQLGGASYLSTLTPREFADLFPKYYQHGLPDVGGFREAISKMSRQKQDDINYGLSQGANSLEAAEKLGADSRRSGQSGSDSAGGSSKVSGSLAANQREAYRAARAEGLSDSAAKILVANLTGENLKNPNGASYADPSTRNPGQRAQGIAAWEQRRAEIIKQHFGKYPNEMSVADQTKAAIWEMKTYYKPSWNALNDDNMDAEQRMRIVVGDFERPKDVQGGVNKRMGFYRGLSVDGSEDAAAAVSSKSTKTGGFFGESQQCVALSKHFSGLGAASSWKVKDGNITAGTVIATHSYNDGSGGKMASSMPDGKSHYHTGIALSTPDKSGNVLILEQFAGQPARVRSININNYNGERWGVVEGGEPNAGTMKAVELGKSLATPDQLALITGGAGVYSTTSTVTVKPTQQAAVAKPTFTTNAVPPAYPEQQQPSAPQDTAKVEKPDKSKKTVDSYKFDPDKYWNEVKTKQPMADSMFYGKDKVMQDTYKGFEEAQAAGAIKWNKKTNEIQILDPNHEQVQKIYQDMKSYNIDKDTFMTKTEAGDGGSKPKKKATAAVEKAPSVFLPDTRHDIGNITGQWEAGKFGADAKFGVGSISTGKGDKGGKSYGQHQLSSAKGTMADFIKSPEGKPYAESFGKHRPGSAAFDKVYTHIATTQPEAFAKAQHSFLDRTHYQPFLKTAAQLGYDVKDPRVQEAIWGGGVQFRNNFHKILNKPTAMASVGKSAEEQVTALAEAKQQAAPKIQNRYKAEAQAILGQTPEGQFKIANVMNMNNYTDYMAEQKSKQASFIAQQNKTQLAAAKPEAPIRSTAIPLIAPSSAAASTNVDGHPVTPDVSAKDSFERMRHMTAPDSVKSAPQTPEVSTQRERHSSINQIPEAPQNPVSINPLMERGQTMQPTPSLARAMDKIRGVESSHYTSLTKTSIG